MTIKEAIDLGISHHQAGRLDVAENVYRQILAAKPDQAHALQLLGLVMAQKNDPAQAIALVHRAVELKPDSAEYRYNLGQLLDQAGRMDEAITAYRGALERDPILNIARLNLGHLLAKRGAYEEATRIFRDAIEREPLNAQLHNYLGVVLRARKRYPEARQAFATALRLNPHYAEAFNNAGILHEELDENDAAADAYQAALALRPSFAEAHNNLGVLWKKLGRLDEAIASYRMALTLRPEATDIIQNLAAALAATGRSREAIEMFQAAIRAAPANPHLRIDFGVTLQQAGFPEAAIESCRVALTQLPDSAEAHRTIGNALKDLGQLTEAILAYRRAASFAPQNPDFSSNILFALHYEPACTAAQLAREHREWGSAAAIAALARPLVHRAATGPRRLRIGYVSGDLAEHPVGRNVHPLFAQHDRARFEIFAYSQRSASDRMTGRLRSFADHWRSIVGENDEQAAALIQRDEIDILVDLSLHSAGNRMPLFARRAAPVQVTFAGYPSTTGLPTMDYRLTDPYLDPPGTRDALYTEVSIRLPHSFWCFDPIDDCPQIDPLPVANDDAIVWGCFNNPTKINDEVLAMWASVLNQTPTSRLIVLVHSEFDERRIAHGLRARAVAPNRIEFARRQPRQQYLELHNRCHAILDTYPYNGHSTSCDALWMGVPVVSLAGETAVSRAGLSLLSNVGHPELVAGTPQEYAQIALGLSQDRARLAALRSGLRARMQASPLMDRAKFVGDIENAFCAMWERLKR